MKFLQKITIILSILVILFGFYQLKYEQDIFAQSKLPCCNAGQCKYGTLPGASQCTSSAGIKLKSDNCAHDYEFTCKECADFSAAGWVCDDPKNSCVDANGNCYGWCKINGVWQWTNPSK